MKKQILNLMLTTAIFTTNPLFAMEEKDQPDVKKNLLVTLPLELSVHIIQNLPPQDRRNLCIALSKEMWSASMQQELEKTDIPTIHNISEKTQLFYFSSWQQDPVRYQKVERFAEWHDDAARYEKVDEFAEDSVNNTKRFADLSPREQVDIEQSMVREAYSEYSSERYPLPQAWIPFWEVEKGMLKIRFKNNFFVLKVENPWELEFSFPTKQFTSKGALPKSLLVHITDRTGRMEYEHFFKTSLAFL